jgi:hypothetical protein
MQRFTLIHDGSEQGWQSAYLAFHVATQLGAPLLVLLVSETNNKNTLAKRAAQVEVGAHAAGVAIETQLITEFSVEVVAENSINSDGLFVPRHLIPDEKTARHFLEALSCPLWFVSKESEMHGMAVLVDDPIVDEALIHFATILSHRIQQPLTGLIPEGKLETPEKSDAAITWFPLPDFSPAEITAALNQLGVDLCFFPISSMSLTDELEINCVISPIA